MRGALVVAMFCVHAYRMQAAALPRGALEQALEAAFRGLMRWEPGIAAGFLFVSGWSAALRPARSLGALARRFAELYLLAIVLFLGQYGPAWRELLLSPGILSVLAWATVLLTVAERRRHVALAHALLASLAVALAALLDAQGGSWVGLNAGAGGAVPLLAFASLGALQHHLTRRARRLLSLAGLALAALTLALGLPLTTTQWSSLPRVDGLVAVTALLHPSRWSALPLERVAFWNHSLAGVAALAGPWLALAWLAERLARPLSARRGLALLGRHALLAYVAHLGLLGALAALGVSPRSAVATALLVAALVALSLLAALLRERGYSKLSWVR